MTRAEHYRAAEKLLGGSRGSPLRARDLAEAQVHALLATASYEVQAEAWAIGHPPANPPHHTGMRAHDGYVAHSHEIRPDHEGVERG
jgi:hypothetical protein